MYIGGDGRQKEGKKLNGHLAIERFRDVKNSRPANFQNDFNNHVNIKNQFPAVVKSLSILSTGAHVHMSKLILKNKTAVH